MGERKRANAAATRHLNIYPVMFARADKRSCDRSDQQASRPAGVTACAGVRANGVMPGWSPAYNKSPLFLLACFSRSAAFVISNFSGRTQ